MTVCLMVVEPSGRQFVCTNLGAPMCLLTERHPDKPLTARAAGSELANGCYRHAAAVPRSLRGGLLYFFFRAGR